MELSIEIVELNFGVKEMFMLEKVKFEVSDVCSLLLFFLFRMYVIYFCCFCLFGWGVVVC